MRKPQPPGGSDEWLGDEDDRYRPVPRGTRRREVIFSGVALLALALMFVAVRGWRQGWAQPPQATRADTNTSPVPATPPGARRVPVPASAGSGANAMGFGGYGASGGMGMMGGYPGMMSGMMPGMAPESASRQAIQARLAPLLERLRRAGEDEQKTAIREEMSRVLQEFFDRDMQQRRTELDALEQRVKRLQQQWERRSEAKEEILQLQQKVLENEAAGLGFFGRASGPGALGSPGVYDPYGGGYGGGMGGGYGEMGGDMYGGEMGSESGGYAGATGYGMEGMEGYGMEGMEGYGMGEMGYGMAPASTGLAPASGASRSVTSGAEEIAMLEIGLAAAQDKLKRVVSGSRQGTISTLEAQEADAAVRVAQQKLIKARREYEAQDRLLEVELRQAQVLLPLAEAELAESLAINQRASNTVPESQVKRQQLAVQLAELAIERAQLLLDLHRKATDASEEPATAEPGAEESPAEDT